jgi:hypothetical protein
VSKGSATGGESQPGTGSSAAAAQDPRKHHFVPQWYLRQFGSKRQIGTFDKATGRYGTPRPKDIAYVEGLYDLDNPILARAAVERLLSNIESCAASAFRLLASQGVAALSDEQREDVAAFVAAQQLRVPSHGDALRRFVSTTLDRIRAELTDDEIRELADGESLTREQIDLIRRPRRGGEPTGVVGGGVVIALRQHTAELLEDFRWSVLEFDRPEIITCDTPVKAMTERDRLGRVSIFADVPIDPSHVVVFQSGGGGRATAARGGVDGWFRHPDGTPSLKCFQNLNFMKAQRYVFGNVTNPIWSALGVSNGPSMPPGAGGRRMPEDAAQEDCRSVSRMPHTRTAQRPVEDPVEAQPTRSHSDGASGL